MEENKNANDEDGPNRSKKKSRSNPFSGKIESEEDKQRRKEKRARIIIRNVSFKATEEKLKEHFKKFGEITECTLLKRPNGQLVGCAFVQFVAVNQAAKAILKVNNTDFLGRPIFVDWAISKTEFHKKQNTIKDDINVKTEEKTPKEENDENNVGIKEEDEKENESEDSDGSEVLDDEDAFSGNESDNQDEEESDEKHSKGKVSIKKEKRENDDKKSKQITNDVMEGCTIFIKNIPFSASSEDVSNLCKKYGPIHYAIINTDSVSGHSKGTAFVKFKSKESADLCLRAGKELTLLDSVLETFPALTREDIKEKTNKSKERGTSDSRNLYLVKEGIIMTGSKAAEGVSASDMAKRHRLERIKSEILKNLNRFVSKNRLSIHNLPLTYDDEKLKAMIEKTTNLKPHECRVMRENKPSIEYPKGKPKGFGFVSFKTHQDALTALRKLNNNPKVFGSQNRPIVGFSIEDRSVHNIKEKRLQKSRENNPTYQNKLERLKQKRKQKRELLQLNEKKGNLTITRKDDKKAVKKDLVKNIKNKRNKTNLNVNNNSEENTTEDFIGVSAKPGTFVRMRSNKKIRAQSQEHKKKLGELKKVGKRKKERLLLQKERREKDRPKQGKKKIFEKDNLSSLVNKYKRMLQPNSSTENEDSQKPKRKKWYTE